MIEGLDISNAQANAMNWPEIQEEFIIMKACEGTSYQDPSYQKHLAGAKSVNKITCAYGYFWAGANPAISMPNWIKIIGPDQHTGPICFDLEVPSPGMAKSEIEAWKDWKKTRSNAEESIRILKEETGQIPILYTGMNSVYHLKLSDSPLLELPIWWASYTKDPHWTKWLWWQYTGTGNTQGAKGYVDKNKYEGSKDDLISELSQFKNPRQYEPMVLPKVISNYNWQPQSSIETVFEQIYSRSFECGISESENS